MTRKPMRAQDKDKKKDLMRVERYLAKTRYLPPNAPASELCCC